MVGVRTIAERVALAVLVLLLPAVPGVAGVEECREAFAADDWPQVLTECRPLAEQGLAIACRARDC